MVLPKLKQFQGYSLSFPFKGESSTRPSSASCLAQGWPPLPGPSGPSQQSVKKPQEGLPSCDGGTFAPGGGCLVARRSPDGNVKGQFPGHRVRTLPVGTQVQVGPSHSREHTGAKQSLPVPACLLQLCLDSCDSVDGGAPEAPLDSPGKKIGGAAIFQGIFRTQDQLQTGVPIGGGVFYYWGHLGCLFLRWVKPEFQHCGEGETGRRERPVSVCSFFQNLGTDPVFTESSYTLVSP